MSSQTLTDYTANAYQFPILGHLLWYSIHEAAQIKHADLVRLLHSVGMDKHTPPSPKDKDVFLRVTSAADRKRIPTNDPDVYENYLIRLVVNSGGTAVKHLVVERVDGADRVLHHVPAIELEFDASKPNKIILNHLTPNDGGEFDQAMNAAELIQQAYEAERQVVNAVGLRQLMRRIIRDAGAAVVRPSGGVYFLLEDRSHFIAALETISAAIPETSVSPVPLPDNSKQRDMLKTAVERETADAIDAAIDEINSLDKISARRYQALVQQMNDTLALADEYTQLLTDLDLDFRTSMYKTKIRQLFDEGRVE